MIGLSNGRDAGLGRRAGPARQVVEWWTSPTGRHARVRGPVENDASMEIRKQRGFPQAARLRRISHRPDGGNASPSTCFQEAAIHLKIGNFLSEEWVHPQGLRLYSTLATAKIGPLQQALTGTKAHHQACLSRLMFSLENADSRSHRKPQRRSGEGGRFTIEHPFGHFMPARLSHGFSSRSVGDAVRATARSSRRSRRISARARTRVASTGNIAPQHWRMDPAL